MKLMKEPSESEICVHLFAMKNPKELYFVRISSL